MNDPMSALADPYQPKRPIKHCYWVLPDRFLAGEYPRNIDDESSQRKIAALITAGVSAFIDLTEEGELHPYAPLLDPYPGVFHHRFEIRDVSIPNTQQTTQILDAIDDYIAQEKMVYVHCWGGVGRTGVIVGCWLARHGYPGKAALHRLREELWPACPKSAYRRSPETCEQKQYIREWRG
jgi:protein-tyrosine phosphatase